MTMRERPLLLLLILVSFVVYSDGGRLPASATKPAWIKQQLELEQEELVRDSVIEMPSVADTVFASSSCEEVQGADCNVTCTLAHLDVFEFNSTDYSCPRPEKLTISVRATSDEAVLRLRLNNTSLLADGESLTVLEGGDVPLAVLTKSNEAWLASQLPDLTLEYQQSDNSSSQIQLTLVAYNQTQETQIFNAEMEGELTAPEQANWTGSSSDYAVNTERYWYLNLVEVASHINFTVTNLDLDPAAGDVLIIGGGKGPYDTEPTAELLTGKFSKRRYHVPGGEAFVYFMSRSHAKPHTPFIVSYEAKDVIGPTTTVPTTTDRNHPPTPNGVDFQLPSYITDIDPNRFLDNNDTATEDLRHTLANWANVYIDQHGLPSPTWRSVHSDDIQFSTWLLCDYTSGWAKEDPNCVRVTWYIELLNVDGDWAFLEPDLRGIILDYGELYINKDLGYKFSLTLDEVNKTWWWAIAIALVPLALLAFLATMWVSSRARKVKSTYDENASMVDLDEVNDDHQDKIAKEVKTLPEKDELHKVFNNDSFREYDPETQVSNRHRGIQARLQPLKSALKKPQPPAYVNAAFEDDNGNDNVSGDARVKTAFSPEEPATVTTPLAQPVAPAAAPAPAVAEPASSELTEQLRLLSELNKTLKEEEKQAPGFELPRIDPTNKPPAAPESVQYSMKEDGTATVVEAARPVANTLHLDFGGSSSGDDDDEHKTSSV